MNLNLKESVWSEEKEGEMSLYYNLKSKTTKKQNQKQTSCRRQQDGSVLAADPNNLLEYNWRDK